MSVTANGAGTPLSRFGTRVPPLTPRQGRPTATRTPTTSQVVPPPTVRTMVVCLPDELPRAVLTTQRLDRHLGVSGTLFSGFWATPALRRWQHHQLIGLRKGSPVCCAGGPLRLLDLTAMRHAAGVGAAIRYQLWTRVVHGTRPATPWSVFHARHLTDPSRYPMDTAKADFHRQPRVHAVRLHNAATHGADRLDPHELEAFQAGPVAYQHYRAIDVIARDALLTEDGVKLAPRSDTLADRITYLDQARRHLDTLERAQRLLTITL